MIRNEFKSIWKLSNISVLSKTKYGLLYKANSKKYGDVVIKYNRDKLNFYSNILLQKYYRNDLIVKTYDFDSKKHIFLMEYLNGENLFAIKNFEFRLNVAYLFFKKWLCIISNISLDGTIHLNKNLFYKNRVYSIIEKIKKISRKRIIIQFTKKLKEISDIYFSIYKDNYLLHGDLHHYNMIYNNGIIKVIDISPVIGSLAFEITKFIENELFIDEKNFEYKIKKILHVFNFENIELNQLLMALFIDSGCRTLDSLIENDKNKFILRGINISNMILKVIEEGDNLEL